MKQFSFIIIMVSFFLGIVSRFINIIDIYFINMDVFSTFSTTYTRFGELTLIVGFLGLYLSCKSNFKIKTAAVAIVLSGFFHFLIIEYGFIAEYDFSSALILLVRLLVLVFFIMQYKDQETDGLRVKGYIGMIITGIYFLAFLIISFIPECIVCSAPHASLTILPFFYIIYQVGLWIFFLELYREIFNYKNEHYIEL